MAVLWNDVKVLNPTTGLYEAYLTRTKQYTPGTGASCLNFVGWNQCTFIANGSFDSGEMLDGVTPLMGQYIRYDIPLASNYPHACDEIIKVIDENEFNSGQMVCPPEFVFNNSGCPSSPNTCTVDYNLLPSTDYSSTAQWITGLPTLDFITYCCKKCTNYSVPLNILNMVCVGGCTDPLALNYDPTQLIDDGSCMYNGCMDILAANYNSQAVFDDGSCVYNGCTDPLASNYNPIATVDDGSCQCIKCCEKINSFGVISHQLLTSTTTPCQCPSGWYETICGQYLGWECDPSTSQCLLVQNGAYSSQTECNMDCENCGCTKLLGTGHTSAFAIALAADCEEYCCDPDLNDCAILVVGDDEGIQVYDPVTNNTSHLFDSNGADVLDIAATRSGNNGFIWVYKSSVGSGVKFLEYAITMVPFTETLLRTITFTNYVVGRGLTYFGHNSSGEVVLTAGAGTGSVQNYTLPIGVVDVTVGGTAAFAYSLPTGYSITGDLITEGSQVANPLDCVLYNNGSINKVGIISRNTGTVLEEHTISTAILTGTTRMEGLFVIATPIPGKIMGITTDGRIYELLQNTGGGLTAGLQFAPTPSGQIDFINNITKTVYGADNLSRYNELCTHRVIQMPESYDCIVSQWGCTDPGTGLGQYGTLADCQANCVVSADCLPGAIAGNCKAQAHILNNTQVQSSTTALQYISIMGNGMQGLNFNTIVWPNVAFPSNLPGICYMKWLWGPSMTIQQKWKIRRISCRQIHPNGYWYTWKSFVTYAAGVYGWGAFNAATTWLTAQNWLYMTFGVMQSTTIKIHDEPCICYSHKCACVPILGPGGQYPNELACLSVPCCPCKGCCRKYTPPYNIISLSPTLYPCKCPVGYGPAICPMPSIIKSKLKVEWPINDLSDIEYLPLPESSLPCKKTCTNGSYYIPLEIDDEHCDCVTYGLSEAPPKCDLCCTDGILTKKLPIYSTICECDAGWYECNTTPVCEKICVSTAKETAKRLLTPEWPLCDCPVGYKVYVDEIVVIPTKSSDSINCSRCEGGEAVTKTFGNGLCPKGWTVKASFKASSCGEVPPPPPVIVVPEVEVVEVVDELVEVGGKVKSKYGYVCKSQENKLVGEKQQSCIPSESAGAPFRTIEDCLTSGCGGFMSCNDGIAVDGVKFSKSTYAPIGMCCESVINSSVDKLTRDYCLKACKDGSETWYPLYNAFGPNTMHDSLLSYMVRELLEYVKNGECTVGTLDVFAKKGFERLK